MFLDESVIDPKGTRQGKTLLQADYGGIIKSSLRKAFPEVRKRRDKKALYGLISGGAKFELYQMIREDPSLIGQTRQIWLTAASDIDLLNKGGVDRSLSQSERRVSDKELAWFEMLQEAGAVEKVFNTRFFTAGRQPKPGASRCAWRGYWLDTDPHHYIASIFSFRRDGGCLPKKNSRQRTDGPI